MAQEVKFLQIVQGPPRWDLVLHHHNGGDMHWRSSWLQFTIQDESGNKRQLDAMISGLVQDGYRGNSAYFLTGHTDLEGFDHLVGYFDLTSRKGWFWLIKSKAERLSDEEEDMIRDSAAGELRHLLTKPLPFEAINYIGLALAEIEHHKAVQRRPSFDHRYGKYLNRAEM